MGKKSSKNIGKNKFNSSLKREVKQREENKTHKLEEKLLEISDEDLEALFESGKIDQSEYEYILAFRKKKREKKKSDKEKFEERIRCNNTIIQKVVNLGRKFRLQEIFQKQNISSKKTIDENNFDLDEQDIEREERVRDTRNRGRNDRSRNSRALDGRSFNGRGRERDR